MIVIVYVNGHEYSHKWSGSLTSIELDECSRKSRARSVAWTGHMLHGRFSIRLVVCETLRFIGSQRPSHLICCRWSIKAGGQHGIGPKQDGVLPLQLQISRPFLPTILQFLWDLHLVMLHQPHEPISSCLLHVKVVMIASQVAKVQRAEVSDRNTTRRKRELM